MSVEGVCDVALQIFVLFCLSTTFWKSSLTRTILTRSIARIVSVVVVALQPTTNLSLPLSHYEVRNIGHAVLVTRIAR